VQEADFTSSTLKAARQSCVFVRRGRTGQSVLHGGLAFDLFALRVQHGAGALQASGFISRGKRGIMCFMPRKPLSTISRPKKPAPMIEPTPVIAPAPAAAIPPLRPGAVAKNLTGKLSRPNPIRRGKR
jgi:hypothetical protein